MKKNLVSLLLVGALVAPGALQTIEATGTGTGTGASYTLIDEVKNDDGTVTKTLLTNYGSTIIQTVDSDGNVTSQTESDPVVPPTSFDDERVYIEQVKYTEPVKFDTIEQETDQLPEGEVVVQTEGVAGVRTFYIDMAYWKNGEIVYNEDGIALVREYNKITQAPVDELILTGTGIMGEEKDTTRIDIPFETKVVENDELPVGTEKVSQEGANGWYELTTIYETKDGVRGDVLKEEHETDRKEPVNKIIQKGTKEVADEFVVTATLVDEEGNALDGETLTITGEDVEQELTTDENGAVTFSVPNGTYTVVFGINSKTVVVEDEDISVELIAGPKDVVVPDEFYIGIVLNDFPQFDKEGNEYEVERLDDFVFVTITDKGGEFVVEIEYSLADNTTRIISIPTAPLEPAKPIKKDEESNDNFYVNVVKNDFPQYDKEGYSYEVEALEDFVFITITNVNGEFVADIEYSIADQTTRIVSIALVPLEPAQPIEETTDEETSEEETTDEESEVVDVVTADGQPVQVVRTDSRSELPETGELGGATAMMAAALSALGGLGLLFKKRK